MLKGEQNAILLADNIAKYTQKECEKVAINLSKKSIKLDKENFKLTNFIRVNFKYFENDLSKYTERKIDFIHKFLVFNGINITKESVNTIYNRLKNEEKNINKECLNEK